MDLLKNAADCQLLLDNETMNSGYPTDGELSAGDLYMTDAGYQLVNINQEDRNLYIWSAAAIRQNSKDQWLPSYYIVYRSNLVLETLEKLSEKGEASQMELAGLRGSALFFRAFAFWQIAQIYAKPYSSSANNDPGIPLRLSSDINGKSVRGTLIETYARIIDDLKEAVNLLQPTSLKPTRPNKTAAYAMLARVYLSMEDYPDALTSADAALQLIPNNPQTNSKLIHYKDVSASGFTSFTTPFNKEVIFHSTSAGVSMNNFFGGSAKTDPLLISSYDSNDLRAQVFFAFFGDGYAFKGSYSGVPFSSSFFNGLAVDELYLIRSECYARASKITEAMADLNALLEKRWKEGTFVSRSATTTDQALAEILSERRKELVFRNLRWTDLRRLNRDSKYAQTLTRTVNGSTYTLPPNDPRYTLLIPQEMITNGGIEQNSR